MKIYISCNGLGLGHVGRTLVLAKYLRERGHEVVFGSWGPAVKFSRKEGFRCYELPAVDWKDKDDGSFDLFGTSIRFPLILIKTIGLVYEERKILKKEGPDAIVTDGTFANIAGRTLGIPSMYVDHQMDFPINSVIIRNVIKRVHDVTVRISTKVNLFDLEPPDNIYPYSETKLRDVSYSGPLVGAKPDEYSSQDDVKKRLKIKGKLCLIIISGPKNSPIALEKKILAIEDELVKMKEWTFIIKVPNKHADKKNIRYVTWIDDVYEMLKACDVVVSRCGYVTACNNLAFSKKSIFIPQPKQVEQETIAKHLNEKRVATVLYNDEIQKLPEMIEGIFNSGIDMNKLKKISQKINNCNAKQKIAEIIYGMSKKDN